MRPEILWRRRHLGGTPYVAEPQRIAADAVSTGALHRISAGTLSCSLALVALPRLRALHGEQHASGANQGRHQRKKLAKGGKPGHVTCSLGCRRKGFESPLI